MNESIKYFQTWDENSVGEAVDSWQSIHPKGGALVLVSEAEQNCVPLLQSLFNTKGVSMTGGVVSALIANDNFTDKGLIIAFVKEMYPYRLHSLSEEKGRVADSTTEICDSLFPMIDEDKKVLLILIDGLFPFISSLLESIYMNLADQVHYIGANMGSNTFQPMPCIFDNQSFIQNGALFILLPDNGEAVLMHGYQSCEKTLPVTSSRNNRITHINWQPALDVYQELVSSYYGIEITRKNFYRLGVHFPFGIVRASGEPLVRIPVSIEPDGSLLCVGEIPDNAMLTLFEATNPDTNNMMERLASRMGHLQSEAVFTFFCAGRQQHLGKHAVTEIDVLARRFSPLPLFGALSIGEIGPSYKGAFPLFHNAAVITLPWSS